MHEFAERIAQLIVKQMEGKLSEAEQKELADWSSQSKAEKDLLNRLNESEYVQVELDKFYSYNREAGWEKIQSEIGGTDEKAPRKISKRLYALAAATVVGLIAGALIWSVYFRSNKPSSPAALPEVATDIPAPVIARPMITLHDGSRIALDSLKPGLMATQAQTPINKHEDGSIAYQPGSSNTAIVYNTLTNPRGSRTVKLTLSDGTRVWMNVDSEIRYPVSFTNAPRQVEVSGEIYFEVSSDKRRPFLVTTGQTTVEVTGTHFNVYAYKDEENIQITLLEGAVQVSKKQERLKLIPGQQAIVNDKIKLNKAPDLEAAMAWKNGLFNFKGADIKAVIGQLSRWYNVDFSLKEGVTEIFHGDISRDNPLSKVLNMLEMTGGVHFKTNGNIIDISK